MTHMQSMRSFISAPVIPPKAPETGVRVRLSEQQYAALMAGNVAPVPKPQNVNGTKHKPETVAKWSAVCDLIAKGPAMTAVELAAKLGGRTNKATIWAAVNWGRGNGLRIVITDAHPPRYTLTKVAS